MDGCLTNNENFILCTNIMNILVGIQYDEEAP